MNVTFRPKYGKYDIFTGRSFALKVKFCHVMSSSVNFSESVGVLLAQATSWCWSQFGWLAGWLDAWLAVWLAGSLAGWLERRQ